MNLSGLFPLTLTTCVPCAFAAFCASCGAAGDGAFALDAAGSADAANRPEGGGYDGGPPVRGEVGSDGGSVSRLYFAVVGDTRPVARDDTEGYPSAVISQIFAGIDALQPRPTFALSTGDYQFASPRGQAAFAQLGVYAHARARYRGALFPAMGDHECTGATASNCGPAGADGFTNPFLAFRDTLLAPLGRASPYYEVDVQAEDGSWTSKVLVLAANAWSPEQEAWLQAAMSRPTTYTFVVRHEPSYVAAAPGVGPSEQVLSAHPYTLAICGHKHSYGRPREREIVVGNGGAPLTGSGDYGFAVVSQQPDGSLAVDMIDYASGRADPGFHFVVGP